MSAETSQLTLLAHHPFEIRADARMADQRAKGFRFPIQQRIKPHIADCVESFLPAHLTRVVDAPSNVFRFFQRQCAFYQNKTILFQLIEFVFNRLHSCLVASVRYKDAGHQRVCQRAVAGTRRVP